MSNKSLLYLFLMLLLFSSCEEESNLPNVGAGSFVHNSGSCSDLIVSGKFVSGTALDESNSVTIKINVTQEGPYKISTQEVNGYSFSTSGNFTSSGQISVRLEGSGTPETEQLDVFNVSFGDQTCSFEVRVGMEASAPEDMSNRILITSGELFMGDGIYTYAFDGNGNRLWSKKGYSDLATIENNIGYLTLNDQVHAINVETGEDLWVTGTADHYFENAVALSENVIYSTDNHKIHAIDASNGEILWSYETGVYGYCRSNPTVVNDVVYFGAPDEYIYALNTDGTLKWRFAADAWVRSSPAVANNLVYASSNNGTLYALDAVTGALAWEYPVGTTGEESPTVSNGKLYIHGKLKLYCLDANSGSKLWEYEFSRESFRWCSPIVQDGVLYTCGDDVSMLAINVADGTLLWSNTRSGPIDIYSPTVLDGVVYLAGSDGLSAVSTETGSTLWEHGFQTASYSNSVVVYDLETKITGYPSTSGQKQ